MVSRFVNLFLDYNWGDPNTCPSQTNCMDCSDDSTCDLCDLGYFVPTIGASKICTKLNSDFLYYDSWPLSTLKVAEAVCKSGYYKDAINKFCVSSTFNHCEFVDENK